MHSRKLKLAFIVMLAMALFTTNLFSQNKGPRASLKASVTQTIGEDTQITITYSRPGVKGRAIWGDIVPWGLNEGNKYSDGKDFPWRAGANENTTIEFTKDVTVEGKQLPAGKYGLHMIPGKDEFVVMFSKVNDLWGSYKYDEANDALRIMVKPITADHQEWLSFGFEDLNGTSAVTFLHWEKLKVPFKISTK